MLYTPNKHNIVNQLYFNNNVAAEVVFKEKKKFNNCVLERNIYFWMLKRNVVVVIMDVRVEPQRKLSTKELMLSNCGVGDDS